MSIPKDSKNIKLDTIRHTYAHLIAAGVKQMFPDAQFGVGPVTENGCYYDMILPRTLIPEDIPLIEKKVKHLLKRKLAIGVQEYSFVDAVQLFTDLKQPLKVELLHDLQEKGTTSLKEEEQDAVSTDEDGELTITVYRIFDQVSGEDLFVDLCKGPHETDFKALRKAGFKIDTFSGSYWRGDQARDIKMQRVYGLVFSEKNGLEEFLNMRKEALARDHRKLGKELDLFTFSELVGAGLPLWTPKGTMIRDLLDQFVWGLRKEAGYKKVTIPHVTKQDLYEASGHWAKFKDELFAIKTRDGHNLYMKPMNCPHHTQIFDSQQRSYRDMPQRYCETTMVYRDEQTGELSGLTRVRSITQDDAHVFCRPNQIKEEVEQIWNIIDTLYSEFGFDLFLRFSRRDPKAKEHYKGDDEVWEKAEAQMKELIEGRVGQEYEDGVGEAAFYGPKIDFMARDSIGRNWQVGTIQLDFNQPEGFDLNCINEDGDKERVVMIHAAIMGSLERFSGVLIEHLAGKFPFWLAPTQIKILPVNDHVGEYIEEVTDILDDRMLMEPVRFNEIRYEIDSRSESIGKKIREATLEKIPMMMIIGPRDQEERTVSLRWLDGKEETISIDDLAGHAF